MTSPGQLEANAAMRLLLLTLAAALLEASKLGGGVSRPSIRSDDDKEARIVEARVKGVLPRPGLKPAGENASDEENQTLSERLLVASQRALLLSADWLRRQNPGLWLLLATAMASNAHANSRSDKRNDLKTIRSQVLLDDDYHISIVTTASLPWMTGTAVNPLLRAAHLAKAGRRVTLMIPWVHPLEQQIIFPGKLTFETPAEQDAYIRNWLQARPPAAPRLSRRRAQHESPTAHALAPQAPTRTRPHFPRLPPLPKKTALPYDS